MERLLIAGAGGFGRNVLDLAENEYEIYFLDDAYEIGTTICGAKVVGSLKDIRLLRKEYENIVIAIGDSKIREKLMNEAVDAGYNLPNIISTLSYISRYATIGYGNVIFPFATIQNGTEIGSGNMIASHSEIHHDSKVGNYCLVYPNTTIRTEAIVGDRVWIGNNVSIDEGVVINDDEIVDNGEAVKKA